jgi:hypothetical protein
MNGSGTAADFEVGGFGYTLDPVAQRRRSGGGVTATRDGEFVRCTAEG